MNPIFADTGYWIAMINPRDQYHRLAMQITAALREERIVTSELVLVEFLNGFAGSGALLRSAAARSVLLIASGAEATVVKVSNDLFARALTLYSERIDKEWSLTDCASFLIMSEYGIESALTPDRHFEQAGFKALMR